MKKFRIFIWVAALLCAVGLTVACTNSDGNTDAGESTAAVTENRTDAAETTSAEETTAEETGMAETETETEPETESETETEPETELVIKGSYKMNIEYNTIDIGLGKTVRVLHASDTHLTLADSRDDDRKVQLGRARAPGFPLAKRCLVEMARASRDTGLPIMHTGDFIDFVSVANLEAVKEFTEENDCFTAAGNHEFSLYVGEAYEDAAYRNQSLDKVQASFKNDIRMSSRVIDGLNFVALDNGYYKFEAEQLAFLKEQVALGLPIVLMIHTPLYDPAFYEDAMSRFHDSAYLCGVPDELLENYAPGHREYQAADAITKETVSYIAGEPLVKAILTGHMHYDYESVFAERIPQICTNCTTLRVVEFK